MIIGEAASTIINDFAKIIVQASDKFSERATEAAAHMEHNRTQPIL